MNVQTSTLNGYNNLYIAAGQPALGVPSGDTERTTLRCQTSGSYLVPTTRRSENGPYTPQMAMAVSINTAYADLWHRVAGNAADVANMAQEFGVNTEAACITGRARR